MVLTPRRRAVIAVLVAFPLAWFCVEIAWRLVYNLLLVLRRPNGYAPCGGGVSGLLSRFNGCGGVTLHWGYAIVELLLLALVAGAAAYGLARWVTQPIRDLARTVGRFGPNSLGLRINPSGPRDETRELYEAIDGMLARLAEGYEAQRRFASTASHELRTPLATQRALIEVSLSSALTAEQLDLLSRQLLATNERNERLVDGLLTLAETERGLLSSAALRLDRIVGDVVDTQRRVAKERDVDMQADLVPATVVGEEPLLDRLASNLIGNAIKYNAPGGSVRVTLSGSGALTVVNSGPVVPADQVAALFEPFRRLAGERLDHGGGVGLGLTIARSIVAAHGGWIGASANPEGGLTVEVGLPLASG